MAQMLRTKAIVLRRVNYGEVDRILTVITPEHGQVSVMARGVRKEKSRLAGGIELFAVCDLVLTRGANNTGEMWTLTGARLNKFFAQIMADYDKLQFGYEAIKQVARASEQIDESEFYDLLETCLDSLDNSKIGLKITETWFYLMLAKLLGNELNVATDNNGMKLVEDTQYDFDATNQVFVFNEVGKYDVRTLKLLRVLTSNRPDVITKIAGVDELIDDCLWLAKIVAKV